MNPILLAELIRAVGTIGLPLVMKLKADIDAGRTKTTVTDEDLAELARLSALTAADIFKRAGVEPPTPNP
jgi:hypothetical protein